MAVLVEGTENNYLKFAKILAKYLTTHSSKFQTLLRQEGVKMRAFEYIEQLGTQPSKPNYDFILLLAALNIKAWRVLFDTTKGLSQKYIILDQINSNLPFESFKDDEKVTIYLDKGKIVPLIAEDADCFSDSQESVELLNDKDLEGRVDLSKHFLNEDTFVDLNRVDSPYSKPYRNNKVSMEVKLQDTLPKRLPVEVSFSKASESQFRSISPNMQSQVNRSPLNPDFMNRNQNYFMTPSYQHMNENSASLRGPPPGLLQVEKQIKRSKIPYAQNQYKSVIQKNPVQNLMMGLPMTRQIQDKNHAKFNSEKAVPYMSFNQRPSEAVEPPKTAVTANMSVKSKAFNPKNKDLSKSLIEPKPAPPQMVNFGQNSQVSKGKIS